MRQSRFLLALVYVLMVVSCQSTVPAESPEPVAEAPVEVSPDPVVPPPEVAETPVVIPDGIEAQRDGFSPRAMTPNNTLALNLRWGNPSGLMEWAVRIVGDDGTAVRTWRGTEAIPTLTWDGNTDAGVAAPQGTYRAILQTAGADGVLTDRARTIAFLLDLVPPSGTLTVSPRPFQPRVGPQDPQPVLTITLAIESGGSPWTTWRLAAVHPDGRRFRDFLNEENRDNEVTWNGKATNNALLEPGVTYQLVAEIFDAYGNRGIVTADLPVAPEPVVVQAPPVPEPTPVIVTLDGAKLSELKVYFFPYSSDLSAGSPEQIEKNQQAMNSLAQLLKEASGTAVTLTGHANMDYYWDPIRAADEQRDELLPLSLARAQAVRQALIALGVDANTLAARGVGAAEPVASFADVQERWKNRRVIVDLVKP